jgi:ribosome-dependent ATPase
MNEAERCDRMSMMHAGRVLAQGRPADLVADRKASTLEEAFIGYLEEAGGKTQEKAATTDVATPHELPTSTAEEPSGFSIGRIWAFAQREAIELRHDSVRLAFAILGPILLMLVLGYGISLDVEHLPFAVLDFDDTHSSRDYVDGYRGSIYFDEMAPVNSYEELDRRLRSGELRFVLEIPPNFESDLINGRQPAVAAYFDAAMPFRAETARGYVEGAHAK